jgi:hypothetical protein
MRFDTDSLQPLQLSVQIFETGPAGNAQDILAFCILAAYLAVVALFPTHSTMAAMIVGYALLLVLAAEHRMPSLTQLLSLTDYHAVIILFGMILSTSLLKQTGLVDRIVVALLNQWYGYIFIGHFDDVVCNARCFVCLFLNTSVMVS